MLKNISLLVLLFVSAISNAQTTNDKPKILYGICSKADLEAAPFDSWFKKNYNDYTPNATTIQALKKENLKELSIKIFFGTWCGDSKREVPRFLRSLDDAGFPASKVTLIATGASDSLYKQSPQHEEAGAGIYKVPTFIFYRNGKEVNRIIEFPATSLEKDMLAIIRGVAYTPNYSSFVTVDKWIADGVLLDSNTSIRGLAMQIKPMVNTEYELNSMGYVLLAHNKMKEAIAVFQVNYFLYPQSANVTSSLGEGYYENGDMKNAVYYLENALGKNTDPKALRGILDILYKAKGVR